MYTEVMSEMEVSDNGRRDARNDIVEFTNPRTLHLAPSGEGPRVYTEVNRRDACSVVDSIDPRNLHFLIWAYRFSLRLCLAICRVGGILIFPVYFSLFSDNFYCFMGHPQWFLCTHTGPFLRDKLLFKMF